MGCQRHAPAVLAPGRDPVSIVHEAWWASRSVWKGANISRPHWDSIPVPSNPEDSRCAVCAMSAYDVIYIVIYPYIKYTLYWQVPVAVRTQTKVCCCWFVGIAGSNAAEDKDFGLSCILCVV